MIYIAYKTQASFSINKSAICLEYILARQQLDSIANLIDGERNNEESWLPSLFQSYAKAELLRVLYFAALVIHTSKSAASCIGACSTLSALLCLSLCSSRGDAHRHTENTTTKWFSFRMSTEICTLLNSPIWPLQTFLSFLAMTNNVVCHLLLAIGLLRRRQSMQAIWPRD